MTTRASSHKSVTLVKTNTVVHVRITMVNAISTLVGEEIEGEELHLETVAGKNGYLYCIPFRARRVIKFNPVDKSMTEIGPDFGDRYVTKWRNGAITGSGVIYCPPYSRRRGILKIDTNTDTAIELDVNLLPERGIEMWRSCAAALDGCVYCSMPYMADRIMKIDPNNNDAMSSIGDWYMGGRKYKFEGTDSYLSL